MLKLSGQEAGMPSATRRKVLALGAALPFLAATRSQAAWAGAADGLVEGYAKIPGGRLWYWDTGGNGEPLIFIHPATGSHLSWKHQRGFFAERGYRVIAYSRWGYGKSDPAPENPRMAHEDLLALMDALHVDRAHVAGVAAGAGISTAIIARAPRRVITGAIMDSVLGFSDPEIQGIYAGLRPSNFHDFTAEYRELSPSFRASSPKEVKAWLEISDAAPARRDSERRASRASFQELAATGIPLLLATGDADLYAPPYLMRLAASKMSNASYATIPEAGHAPFWENPEAFNALLLRHLSARP